MRYIKQKDNYSCGPVAIVNALKWAGEKTTYKNIKEIKQKCNCVSPSGMWHSRMTAYLRKNKSLVVTKIRESPNIKIKEIDNWLGLNNIVILRYNMWVRQNIWAGHYIMISDKTDGLYKVHNIGDKSSLTLTVSQLKYMVKDHLGKWPPDAWFIRKKNNG